MPLRVLIYSRAFLPQVGGLELNVAHLAEQLGQRGDEVVVVTSTPGGGEQPAAYRVLRNPGALEFLRWMRWCDVFHQPNVSLRGFWPLLLVPRPWVVSHHSWYRRPDGRIAWQDRLKRFLLRFAAGSIAVSRAVADDLATPSVVVNNAYRDNLFRVLPGVERSLDLVFVGRLVSDKGVDILLDALGILAAQGIVPALSVVGEGPERPRLESQAQRLGLAARVRFLGVRTGEDLVRILNQHRILVVPSRYNEPFGIVALEGIACGCAVVGSAGGGLRDAIGPCGETFPNADTGALATVLARLLLDPSALEGCRADADRHLAMHAPGRVTEEYARVLRAAIGSR
jgi:glycogen synthase